MEKILETQGELVGKNKRECPGVKQCKKCNSHFNITDKDLEFYDKVSPVCGPPPSPLLVKEGRIKDMGNGKFKYSIPTPTFCPDCRQQRRLSFRNERNLYKRKCDATGEDIISMYSPDKEYKVYNLNFWLSDRWDAIDYGKNFDFNKNAFIQFDELLKSVPRIPFFQSQNENSEYSNGAQKNKDCYMVFVSDYNENSYYTNGVWYSNNVMDCLGVNKSQNCYEAIDCDYCYNCFYSQDLINCNNCYNCKGLIGKSFCIENKQYSKSEYLNKISLIRNKNIIFGDKVLYLHGFGIENSTGDFLKNVKNSKNCFDSQNLQNVSNLIYGVNINDCQDGYVVVDNSSKCYEIISSINCNNTLFGYTSWYNNNCYYIDTCQNSSNLFLCTGLKNKQYCILNKQYTKEEYNKLVPKIIEYMMTPHLTKEGLGVVDNLEQGEVEWGEFFPSSLSPFGYNETVANEYFPLTPPPNPLLVKEGGKDNSIFNWSYYESPTPNVEKIIPVGSLPDNIEDIPDDILNWAIECEITKKPFRIIKQELEFYRKHNLPISKRHPDQRHLDRMKLRNPRKLFDRDCDKCGVNMKTTYSSERPEKVYCEECYEKEVY